MSIPGGPLTGGCACGAVRYRIDAPIQVALWCHCTRCRRRTGTGPSLNGRLAPGSLRITSGDDRLGVWAPADGFEKHFCRDCGSGIFSRSPTDPGLLSIRIGTLDRDPGVRPAWHQYVADRAPWDRLPDDGLPRHDGAAPPA